MHDHVPFQANKGFGVGVGGESKKTTCEVSSLTVTRSADNQHSEPLESLTFHQFPFVFSCPIISAVSPLESDSTLSKLMYGPRRQTTFVSAEAKTGTAVGVADGVGVGNSVGVAVGVIPAIMVATKSRTACVAETPAATGSIVGTLALPGEHADSSSEMMINEAVKFFMCQLQYDLIMQGRQRSGLPPDSCA